MLTFVAMVHIALALILIVFVLLQDSKGGAMGVFSSGGASSSVFGSSGAGNVLVSVTKWLAVGFAATCIGLAYMTSQTGDSVLDEAPAAATAPSDEVIDTTQSQEESMTAPESKKSSEEK